MTAKDLLKSRNTNDSVQAQQEPSSSRPTRTTRTVNGGLEGAKGEQIGGPTPRLYSTHHNWDVDVKGVTVDHAQHPVAGSGGEGDSSRYNTALPVFPPLAAMGQADFKSLTSDLSDPHQIAKEAMRLTKQTLMRHEQTSPESKFPYTGTLAGILS